MAGGQGSKRTEQQKSAPSPHSWNVHPLVLALAGVCVLLSLFQQAPLEKTALSGRMPGLGSGEVNNRRRLAPTRPVYAADLNIPACYQIHLGLSLSSAIKVQATLGTPRIS